MFRKVLAEIGKVFSTGKPISTKSTSSASARYEEMQAKEKREAAESKRAESTDAKGNTPSASGKRKSQAPVVTKSAEELCGLEDGMTVDDLREHLKLLYRRHNRAASSLDEDKRIESNAMLDAIVEVRQRYIDKAID